MNELPKRKPIRIENYDYSTPGAYFITICTANREKISPCKACSSPAECAIMLAEPHYCTR